jgi:hypothetical protein
MSFLTGSAYEDAGKVAAASARQAAALQQQRYDQVAALYQPVLETGDKARTTYATAVGLNGGEAQAKYYQDFQADPGWQAAQDYAQRQAGARAAAQGQGLSGNTLAALAKSNLTSLNSAYTTRLGEIGTLMNAGNQAIASFGGYTNTATQNQANDLIAAGQAEATGMTNAANARTSTLMGLGTLAAGVYGMANGYNLSGLQSVTRAAKQLGGTSSSSRAFSGAV